MAEWKLAPAKATPEMERAADAYAIASAHRPKGFWWWGRLYEAMLAASPQAPAGQQAEPTDAEIMALAVDMDLDHLPISAKRFARAVLALAHRQSEWRLLPAKMLMPDPTWEGDVDEATYKAGWNDCIDALAGQQSERPAPAGQAVGERWRPEVIAFADAMESKLRQNDWKGGWKDDSPGQLMERVREEFREFQAAHLAYPRGTDAYKSNLRDEGADVANMVMMVLDVNDALAASQAERPAVKEGD